MAAEHDWNGPQRDELLLAWERAGVERKEIARRFGVTDHVVGSRLHRMRQARGKHAAAALQLRMPG